MPALPEADEPHIGSPGFWRIVLADVRGELHRAFIIGQDAARDAPLTDFTKTMDEIEERSGLTMLWRLPDAEQAVLKSADDASWLIGE